MRRYGTHSTMKTQLATDGKWVNCGAFIQTLDSSQNKCSTAAHITKHMTHISKRQENKQYSSTYLKFLNMQNKTILS
jgi:hypothetical protein